MSDKAPWREQFPLTWSEDQQVTRREFTRSLAWLSGACFASTAAVAGHAALAPPAAPFAPVKVAGVDELPVGGSKVFTWPGGDEPWLLVRTADDGYVAYGQRCTHLQCPVFYEASEQRLRCPCHEGYFSARDGSVTAGPPPRALPRVELERRGDELWAVGVRP